jgi:hypothetical protein
LGEAGHLLVQSGEEQLTVVTGPYLKIEKGDPVGLAVDKSEVFIFDPATGKAIMHGIE